MFRNFNDFNVITHHNPSVFARPLFCNGSCETKKNANLKVANNHVYDNFTSTTEENLTNFSVQKLTSGSNSHNLTEAKLKGFTVIKCVINDTVGNEPTRT